MKFDKSIKEGKLPFSCIDCIKAREFLDKEGYFTDNIIKFTQPDFKKETYLGKLYDIDNSSNERPFQFNYSTGLYYKYFLPEKWVKSEKKYRAYTLIEFICDMDSSVLEPWIRMRPVGTNKECKFLYTGYQETEVGEYICLGCYQFDFISLFKNYEIFKDGEWKPFGIKE